MTKYETTTEETEILVLEGRIEALEWILDAEDQEADLDGRPTTEPYRLFHLTDREVELIEYKVAELTTQLQALKQKARVS